MVGLLITTLLLPSFDIEYECEISLLIYIIKNF
jgi:hypothetical protein